MSAAVWNKIKPRILNLHGAQKMHLTTIFCAHVIIQIIWSILYHKIRNECSTFQHIFYAWCLLLVCTSSTILTWDNIYAIALIHAMARTSICLSHEWISQKRLKLGSCNFYYIVAPSLWFLQDRFYPKILTGSFQVGTSNNGSGENKLFYNFMRQYLKNGRRYIQNYY